MVTSINETHHVSDNQIIILNSCQSHELISEDSALLLIFQFNSKQFEWSFPKLNELYFLTQPIELTQEKNHQRLLNNLLTVSCYYFDDLENVSLLCHGFLSLILFDLMSIAPYDVMPEQTQNKLLLKNERIIRISNYIQQHFHQKILLSDIAKTEDLTVPYLSHFFKEHFGLTFQEYLHMIRCEEAFHLLLNTQHSLLTISEICGFSDTRYLNSAFKKNYGMAPKELRDNQTNAHIYQYQLKTPNPVDQQLIYSTQESYEFLHRLNYEKQYEPDS